MLKTLVQFIAVAAIAFGGANLAEARADDAKPYGGCKEAHVAPQSDGARECRAKGWTVTKHLVLSPQTVLRYIDLPACKQEDGSGQKRPGCHWNLSKEPTEEQGDGHGLVYVVQGPHVHYLQSCYKHECAPVTR